jgi:hypothetical protein
MAESFVATFKRELVKGRVFASRFEAEIAVVEYLGWFNHLCRGRHKWFYADVRVMPT